MGKTGRLLVIGSWFIVIFLSFHFTFYILHFTLVPSVLAQEEAPPVDEGPPAPVDEGPPAPVDEGPPAPVDEGPPAPEPGSIDPNAVPTEVTEVATPGVPGPDTPLDNTPTGVANADGSVTISPDSTVHDAALSIARNDGNTVDISQAPPGAQVGDVIENLDGTLSEVTGTPQAQAPPDNTAFDQPPDAPPDTTADGESPNSPALPGVPGSPSSPVSVFFNSLLKKCYTPSSWLASPPQPIQVTAFSPSGIRAVSFRVTNLSSPSQEVFPAKKATPVIFEKKFKEKDIRLGSSYKLEAQAVDTRGRFSGWKAANTTFSYQDQCLTPWIQTTSGDVHANTRIDTPGGP